MLEPVNLLVLDEPTNHLDMQSKEILKEALAHFTGTVIVVSHDREFLDGMVDCVYEFRNKKIKQHLGGIYDFLQKKKMESLKELEVPSANGNLPKNNKPNNEAKNRGISFEERKEINRNISKLEKAVVDLEETIESLENEISEMDELLAKPENLNDEGIYNNYDTLKTKLAKTMEQWEKLHKELETWKEKKAGNE
jgi:ATP-binding cassette subfamily F protein 3